nr:MAG TPA: Protein of unknown function (DUF1062) [Bacteriophage sp.]
MYSCSSCFHTLKTQIYELLQLHQLLQKIVYY